MLKLNASCAQRWWKQGVVWVGALLFVLTLAKGMVWVALVPIGQHPDEPVHAVYADAIGRDLSVRPGPRVPSVGIDQALTATSFGRMPFNAHIKMPFDDESLAERQVDLSGTAETRHQLGTASPASAADYPPLYYFLSGLVVRGSPDAQYDTTWLLERSFSAIIAALTIVVQFAVFLMVFPGSVARAGIAALTLTMMPMYTAMESAINPEVLLVLWGSAIIGLSIRLLRAPYSWRLHALSGLVMTAALLTKPNGAVLLVPYLTGAILGAVQGRFAWRAAAGRAVAFAAPIVLIYGGWRSLPPRAGGFRSSTAGWPEFHIDGASLEAFFAHLSAQGRWRFSELYWGVFGWVDTAMPANVLSAAYWFGIGVFVVIVIAAFDRELPPFVWVCVASVVATLALVLFIEYLSVLSQTGGFAQGRYFFSVVAAIVAIQMWAVDRLFRARWRLRTLAWAIAPVAVGAFHLVAVFRAVVPRYFL